MQSFPYGNAGLSANSQQQQNLYHVPKQSQFSYSQQQAGIPSSAPIIMIPLAQGSQAQPAIVAPQIAAAFPQSQASLSASPSSMFAVPEIGDDGDTETGTTSAAVVANSRKLKLRKAGGQVWSDPTLEDWPSNDFRVFCGDLGNEVTDELLSNAFRHFKSFQKARVIRDRRTGKGRGFGFVSFGNPEDMLRAMTEMDKKYVGNRPIRVMKSKWREREIDSDRNKHIGDLSTTTPIAGKTLKKFKVMKPITGGKKSKAIPPALAASGTRRGFHGPRPPPFSQLPRIARAAQQQMMHGEI